ncbi:MAG TPA: alpha/beta fold hydrolase [Acidimicrobiales bacterium]|nr:alpha/beta fold hydrolase [Acidimicrobiales bacterium]
MDVSVTGPDGGEVIDLGPIQMRILEDGSATGHRLGIGEITLPPHTDGPPQHVHGEHDEGFYVVAGSARFTVGERTHDAIAGTLVMVPPGAPHTFANVSEEPAVLLNTFTPDLYVQYFRDLRDVVAGGEPLTPAATIEAMARYATSPAAAPAETPKALEAAVVTIGNSLDVPVVEGGSGRPVLVLHGGGGPATVASIVARMAGQAHVVAPTHPGWDGTERPDSIASIADLAAVYNKLLGDLDLAGVLVIGSSIGGWIALEMALGDEQGRIGGLVLLNSTGIEVEGEPILDVGGLLPRELASYSFHDPERFFVDPATWPPERVARQRAAMATMQVIAGPSSADPGLLERLSRLTVPALVVWGESDRVATERYGRVLAGALAGARFVAIEAAGHLPHVEQPEAVFAVIDDFVGELTC